MLSLLIIVLRLSAAFVSISDFLEHLVDLPVIVELRNGEEYTGVLQSLDDDNVQLTSPELVIHQSHIKDIRGADAGDERRLVGQAPSDAQRASLKTVWPQPGPAAEVARNRRYMDLNMLITLNGDRKIRGTMRGFDQFMNCVVDEAIDETRRRTVSMPGQIVVRGNSIVHMELLDRRLEDGDVATSDQELPAPASSLLASRLAPTSFEELPNFLQVAEERRRVQPINLIFRFLQESALIQVWLYEQVNVRIEGTIIGFDEYMNLVLDNATEVHLKNKTRKSLGRIMLKGDNITLIQRAA